MKISTKIFSTLLFSALPLLLLSGIIFYASEKKTLQRQISNHLLSVASLQHARLDSIIRQNNERLQLVSSRTQLRISLKKYLEGDNRDRQREQMIHILEDAKSSIKSFRNIHIFSLEDNLIASTEGMDGAATLPVDTRVLDRAKSENTADHLYLNPNGKLLVLLAGPLLLGGNLLGTLLIESEVENIISSISNYTGLGDTGEIIVARKNRDGGALFLFPTRFDPGAALSRTILNGKISSPLIQALSRQRTVISQGVDYRDKAVLTVSELLSPMDWIILVKMDQSEAFVAIHKAGNLIAAVTASLILISVVIAWVVSRNITRPILYLTRMTKKIAQDGLLIEIEQNTNDEIGELTSSFNEMIKKRKTVEEERENIVVELQKAIAEVKVLRGILPICSICKNIRNDEGYYEQIENYIHKHSGVDFSHTICPNCMKKHYPEYLEDE